MKFKILVIGDSCEDVFIYGKVDRLSPEGPVPVFIPLYEVKNGGMAKNVVRNLESMGADVDLVTNTTPLKKVRYVDDSFNHLFLRVDEGNYCESLDRSNLPNLKNYDAILISDYNKGFLSEDDVQYISNNHNLVIIDTKKKINNWIENASFIKINFHEYQNNLDFLNKNQNILNKTLITRGKYGCDFLNKNYPTEKVDVKDVSGAGDTFVAAFLWKYLFTNNVELSITYANNCSTIVVQKRGVNTI
jgi:D-beta-D-heptose 7-phosphate kinase/D-beta-D-heptose 1-phosphate adenosyltransferase